MDGLNILFKFMQMMHLEKKFYKDMEVFMYRVNPDSIVILCSHERIVHLFRPVPISWITGFVGYFFN